MNLKCMVTLEFNFTTTLRHHNVLRESSKVRS